MANPTALSDIVTVLLSIVTGSFPGGSVADACLVSTFASSAAFPTRQKTYAGTPTEIDAALAADGFAEGSDAREMAAAYLDNDAPVGTLRIGRRDAGDASWTATMTAIEAEDDSFALVGASTRTKAEQLQIMAWCEPRWKYYRTITREPGVPLGSAGTLAAAGFTAKYLHSAATYYVAATATDFGPAVIDGSPGTFSITNGWTVVVSPEGGADQTFTFAAAAATVTGANTAPFNDVWSGNVIFNGTDDVGVTVTGLADLFVASNTSNDQTATDLRAAWNGSAPHAAVATASGGTNVFTLTFLDGLPHTVTPYSPATADITGGAFTKTALEDGQTITAEFDDAAAVTITFDDDATYFPSGIAAATAAQTVAFLNAFAPQITWSVNANRVVATSQRPGTGSKVKFNSGTGLTALGFTVGTTSGTGDFVFADVATAAEVATKINATATGFAAAAVGTYLRLTSDSDGEDITLEVVEGTALDELGLEVGVYYGVGVEEDWHDCAVLGILAQLAARLDTPNGSFPMDNQKLRARTGMTLTGSQRLAVHAQNCNTYEQRTANYPGELHQGVVFSGANEDFVIFSLWLQLRMVEAIKGLQDSYAARKQRIPYTDEGIAIVDNVITGVLSKGAASGAMLGPDLSPFDPLTKVTGYTKPTIAQQSSANRAIGKVSGWRIVQLDAGAIKKIEIDLILSTQ